MSRIKASLAILGVLAAFVALPAGSAFAKNTGNQRGPGNTGPPCISGGPSNSNGSFVIHKSAGICLIGPPPMA
jgi:hypothetical protein